MDERAQPAACRFPARFAWLRDALEIGDHALPAPPCPLFERWRAAIAPERVSMVYASAYVSSPASMYGHTFLRLSRATGAGNRLIDYIVNYAADVDTENGLVYAFKGLFGGFVGRFY
jgi:hypothetical protein